MTTLILAAAVLMMLAPGVGRMAYQPQERTTSGRRC